MISGLKTISAYRKFEDCLFQIEEFILAKIPKKLKTTNAFLIGNFSEQLFYMRLFHDGATVLVEGIDIGDACL
jgi:hypothetical protein